MTKTFVKSRIEIYSAKAEKEFHMEETMKKLPDSELELMMIIWHADHPLSRTEIEKEMPKDRKIGATTVLSFLSRLEEKGFLKVTKIGKNNFYESILSEQEYLQKESGSILKKMYRNSVRNFMTALYDGEHLTDADLDDLQKFLDEKRGK